MRVSLVITTLSLALALATPVHAQDNRTLARENFAIADVNEDGKLSKSEFRVFIDENAKDDIGRASMVRRMGAYDTAFKRLDANKDGFVARSEINGAKKK